VFFTERVQVRVYAVFMEPRDLPAPSPVQNKKVEKSVFRTGFERVQKEVFMQTEYERIYNVQTVLAWSAVAFTTLFLVLTGVWVGLFWLFFIPIAINQLLNMLALDFTQLSEALLGFALGCYQVLGFWFYRAYWRQALMRLQNSSLFWLSSAGYSLGLLTYGVTFFRYREADLGIYGHIVAGSLCGLIAVSVLAWGLNVYANKRVFASERVQVKKEQHL
jgi:hypothetical protein